MSDQTLGEEMTSSNYLVNVHSFHCIAGFTFLKLIVAHVAAVKKMERDNKAFFSNAYN